MSSIVLKSLLFALRTLAEGFKADKIFRCGSRDDFYELVSALMEHVCVSIGIMVLHGHFKLLWYFVFIAGGSSFAMLR